MSTSGLHSILVLFPLTKGRRFFAGVDGSQFCKVTLAFYRSLIDYISLFLTFYFFFNFLNLFYLWSDRALQIHNGNNKSLTFSNIEIFNAFQFMCFGFTDIIFTVIDLLWIIFYSQSITNSFVLPIHLNSKL